MPYWRNVHYFDPLKKNNNQCGEGKRHILVDFNAMTSEASATAPRLVSPHYISYENWFVILVAVHRIRANTPVCIDCRWDTFVIPLRKKKTSKKDHAWQESPNVPSKKKKDKTEFLCQESRNFNKNDKGKKKDSVGFLLSICFHICLITSPYPKELLDFLIILLF